MVHGEPAAGPGEGAAAGAPLPSAWSAFLLGIRTVPPVPTVVLLGGIFGYGALAHDLGLTLGQAVFLTATVFALPGQVVLIDQLARGATLSVAAFAVLLTAVRLLPMTVVLSPYLRGSRLPRALSVLAVHFVAVTLWVEGLRVLPGEPPAARLPLFLGWVVVLYGAAVVTTGLGYLAAAAVTGPVAAVLLFMTPLYFSMSMLGAARNSWGDQAAVAVGLVLGPLFYLVAPGVDLILTGVVGGALAYGLGRWGRPW